MQCVWLVSFLGICTTIVLVQSSEQDQHSKNSDLVFVFKITRHGARTPASFYPGDPNNNYWTDELGELTNVGKNQLYEMGKLARSQYKTFLSELYKPEEINVQSTQMDRTIMSAACFAASLYRPIGSQVWNNHLDWQPVPVYILNYDVNNIIAGAIPSVFENCPAGLQDDQFYNKHKKTIQAIQKASGIQYSSCLDSTFFGLLDTLVTERFYNLTAPYGLGKIFNDVNNLKNAFMVAEFAAPVMRYALNAPLINDIVTSLEQKSNKTNPAKAYTYFMHDANVLAFLAATTDWHQTSPLFASSITIEMFNTKGTNDYNVKIYYTETPSATRQLQFITGCGNICPLPTFLNILRNALKPPTTSICPCQTIN